MRTSVSTPNSTGLGRGKRATSSKIQNTEQCSDIEDHCVVKEEPASPQKKRALSSPQHETVLPLRKSNRSRNKRQKNFAVMAGESADSDSDELAESPNKVQKRKRCRAGKRPNVTRKPQNNRKISYTGNIGSITDAKKEIKRKLLLRIQSSGHDSMAFDEPLQTPRYFPTPPKPISPGAYPTSFSNKENLREVLNSPLSRARPKIKKEPSFMARSRNSRSSSTSDTWVNTAVEANPMHEMALANLFQTAPIGSGPNKPFEVEMNPDSSDTGLSMQFVEQEHARQDLFRSVTLSAHERDEIEKTSKSIDGFFMPPGLDIGSSNNSFDLLKGITDLFDSGTTNAAMQCSPRFGLADTTNTGIQCSPRFGLADTGAGMQCSPRFGLGSQSLKNFLDEKMLNANEELFSNEVLAGGNLIASF